MAGKNAISAVTSTSISASIGRYAPSAQAGRKGDAGQQDSGEQEASRYDVLEFSQKQGKKGKGKNIGLFSQLKESTRELRHAARQLELLLPDVTAPGVLGMPLREAMAAFQAAGLPVAKVSHKYSTELPKGHVLIQMPGPGTQADRRLGVALVVSKGPKQ